MREENILSETHSLNFLSSEIIKSLLSMWKLRCYFYVSPEGM